MPSSMTLLIQWLRAEAESAEFPIDKPVYEQSERDPLAPIFYAGSLEAPLCVVGRDLGKDEVRAGQPLIGAAGRLVRAGIAQAWEPNQSADNTPAARESAAETALRHALLSNLVPYKPPGNKAYAESVRERFRPFLQDLLGDLWEGDRLITLGSEAFHWFERYGDRAVFQSVGKTDGRFQSVFQCRLPATLSGWKTVYVYPLPHPSPLNRRWYSQFPEMLAGRLTEIIRALNDLPS